jgi:hypothetical protein
MKIGVEMSSISLYVSMYVRMDVGLASAGTVELNLFIFDI